jgi:hypothetical protein
MRQSITRKRSKTPMCDQCGGPLETAATARNPSAEIRANSIASCPSCMCLFLVDADLRPLSAFEIADEAEWNAALRVAFAADLSSKSGRGRTWTPCA